MFGYFEPPRENRALEQWPQLEMVPMLIGIWDYQTGRSEAET